MDARKLILLVGALVVAGLTAFMARALMTGSATPVAAANVAMPAPVDGPRVLVATRALPVGTIIDAGALRFQPWPKELVENAYYLESAAESRNLVGTVVRFDIPAGQPITQGSLVKPGDRGFLAAALGPGMRAVTVPVSAQSAVAGFVFPGDRVDLVLTQTVAGGGDGPPLKASETFLRNLRVLATDQRTDKDTDEQGKTVVSNYSTVTVEATPRIAEKIAVAQTVGTLSLSLRSIADNRSELEEAIASGDVTLPDNADPKAEKAALERLAARPIDGPSTFSTGADVSRFQRSTVPGRGSGGGGGGEVASVMPAATVSESNASSPPPAPRGPVVRITRGNSVTDVSVGGNN
ncbi:Flp pilus assembly protein CpaB [Sphingomonas sp. VNH70]|uniref:Flp pilus assembly protein CpaB n=1 Tax=Sphingomonas silueang TaxID=3156617 RepID=UPI0032B4FBE9